MNRETIRRAFEFVFAIFIVWYVGRVPTKRQAKENKKRLAEAQKEWNEVFAESQKRWNKAYDKKWNGVYDEFENGPPN